VIDEIVNRDDWVSQLRVTTLEQQLISMDSHDTLVAPKSVEKFPGRAIPSDFAAYVKSAELRFSHSPIVHDCVRISRDALQKQVNRTSAGEFVDIRGELLKSLAEKHYQLGTESFRQTDLDDVFGCSVEVPHQLPCPTHMLATAGITVADGDLVYSPSVWHLECGTSFPSQSSFIPNSSGFDHDLTLNELLSFHMKLECPETIRISRMIQQRALRRREKRSAPLIYLFNNLKLFSRFTVAEAQPHISVTRDEKGGGQRQQTSPSRGISRERYQAKREHYQAHFNAARAADFLTPEQPSISVGCLLVPWEIPPALGNSTVPHASGSSPHFATHRTHFWLPLLQRLHAAMLAARLYDESIGIPPRPVALLASAGSLPLNGLLVILVACAASMAGLPHCIMQTSANVHCNLLGLWQGQELWQSAQREERTVQEVLEVLWSSRPEEWLPLPSLTAPTLDSDPDNDNDSDNDNDIDRGGNLAPMPMRGEGRESEKRQGQAKDSRGRRRSALRRKSSGMLPSPVHHRVAGVGEETAMVDEAMSLSPSPSTPLSSHTPAQQLWHLAQLEEQIRGGQAKVMAASPRGMRGSGGRGGGSRASVSFPASLPLLPGEREREEEPPSLVREEGLEGRSEGSTPQPAVPPLHLQGMHPNPSHPNPAATTPHRPLQQSRPQSAQSAQSARSWRQVSLAIPPPLGSRRPQTARPSPSPVTMNNPSPSSSSPHRGTPQPLPTFSAALHHYLSPSPRMMMTSSRSSSSYRRSMPLSHRSATTPRSIPRAFLPQRQLPPTGLDASADRRRGRYLTVYAASQATAAKEHSAETTTSRRSKTSGCSSMGNTRANHSTHPSSQHSHSRQHYRYGPPQPGAYAGYRAGYQAQLYHPALRPTPTPLLGRGPGIPPHPSQPPLRHAGRSTVFQRPLTSSATPGGGENTLRSHLLPYRKKGKEKDVRFLIAV
jgi:hypothetical protein